MKKLALRPTSSIRQYSYIHLHRKSRNFDESFRKKSPLLQKVQKGTHGVS